MITEALRVIPSLTLGPILFPNIKITIPAAKAVATASAGDTAAVEDGAVPAELAGHLDLGPDGQDQDGDQQQEIEVVGEELAVAVIAVRIRHGMTSQFFRLPGDAHRLGGTPRFYQTGLRPPWGGPAGRRRRSCACRPRPGSP